MIIVYPGTFNPPTKAHIEIIKFLKKRYNNVKFIIVPTNLNNYPYKKKEIEDEIRLELIYDAFKKEIVSIYEMCQNDYKGTYSTLNYLKSIYNEELYLLMGADNYINLDKWINYEKLIKSYKIIVVGRNGTFINSSSNIIYIPFKLDISSTNIRSNVDQNKKNIKKSTYKLINKYRLYQN